MKRTLCFAVILFLSSNSFAMEHLLIFAGSAGRPALEEISRKFEDKNRVRIDINFGGSGGVLSQMKLGRKGDIYIPGSPDFMEKAKRDKLVLSETEKILAYLIPSICISPENNKGITSIGSLLEKNVKLGIGAPGTVCVGLYAVEIIEKSGLREKIKPNIITYAESCSKTASLLLMGNVDAVFGWRVFQFWDPDKIKSIPIGSKYIKRIGYIPAAVSVYCGNKKLAMDFIDYLTGNEGREIFKKRGYITDPNEAGEFASEAVIGGEYILPEGW